MTFGDWPYLPRAAILAGLYFAAGKLGLAMAFENASVSPVWPPTGLALAGLTILGLRFWPAIAAGAFLVNVTTPTPSLILTACGITVGNTLEAVVGAWLLTRAAGFRPSLDRLQDVVRLVFFAAIFSTMVSATVGVLTLCVGDPALWSNSGRLWWQWWVGDAMGDLVVAPVLLLWCVRHRFAELHRREVEALALLGGLLGTGLFVFGRHFDEGFLDNSYWVFPFLIWAAVRFGPRGIATAQVVVSAVAIMGTLNGYGPFVRDSTSEGAGLVLLQMFLGIATIMGLVLAAITAEREHAIQALRTLNEELEERIADRTMELAQTNRELAQKNEENETFVYSVSHDLRSPLVNLQGFSQELTLVGKDIQDVLSDAAVPEAVQQRGLALLNGDMKGSIQFIQAGVVRLSHIIDALLQLSRVGRVEYHMQLVELNQVVARVVASMHSSIVERGATVTVADLPPVWGDPTATEQVFANLIGNALNYLDPRRPGVVHVGSTAAKPGGSGHTYFVQDNGLGIAELHRVKLFHAFQRLHPGAAKGEGMGLTFVRRIVERHGGTIWVESTVDVGSTFFVALPVQAPGSIGQDTSTRSTASPLESRALAS
jgi:signal transduction histidine kinase